MQIIFLTGAFLSTFPSKIFDMTTLHCGASLCARPELSFNEVLEVEGRQGVAVYSSV